MTGKREHIVVTSEYISPASNSTGEYFFDIVEGFVASGCFVTIVIPMSTDNRIVGDGLYKQYPDKVRIEYVPYVSDQHGATFGKAIGSFKLTFHLWRRARKAVDKNSTIFFGTNPTFLILLNALLPSAKSSRKVMLCYDIFPDNLIAVSESAIIRGIGRLIRPLFKMSYKRLDKVLVIGRCMAQRVEKLGVKRERVAVVSNWADGEEITPNHAHNARADRVHFQFFGNMGPLQGVQEVLQSFKYVTVGNAHFSFIGRGAHAASIRSFIESNSTRVSVEFFGPVKKSQRSRVLNDCDIAVVSLDKKITGLGVPSKSYFSLAAAKPILVIADEGSEPSLLVQELNVGWTVPIESPQQIARKIDEICLAKKFPSRQYVRSVFEQLFSRQAAAAKVVSEARDIE